MGLLSHISRQRWPRMRPAVEAGLKLRYEAAALFVRAVQ
jgi:hypothetical protein